MPPAGSIPAFLPIPESIEIRTIVRRAVLVLLATGAERLVCDLYRAEPNAVTVDALARVVLAARRAGAVVEVRGASDELRGLIELFGLTETL